MNTEKIPNWLRGLYIIIGLITVALGIVVLLMPSVAIETLAFLLYLALLFVALGRMLIGTMFKDLPRGLRIINVVAGLALLGIAIMVLAYQYPFFATAVMISLLALGLLIDGITRIAIGGFAKILANWVRASLVVGGILTVILSIVVLVFPDVAVLTLVFLLSIGLIWSGADAIFAGATGSP